MIHRDRQPGVERGPAEKARVGQRGVDHQRPGVVVGTDGEADAAVLPKGESPRNGHFVVATVLIDDGCVVAELTPGHRQHQVAVVVDAQRLYVGESQVDDRRISARSNDEVVLQLPLVAVVADVDARVDRPVPDLP